MWPVGRESPVRCPWEEHPRLHGPLPAPGMSCRGQQDWESSLCPEPVLEEPVYPRRLVSRPAEPQQGHLPMLSIPGVPHHGCSGGDLAREPVESLGGSCCVLGCLGPGPSLHLLHWSRAVPGGHLCSAVRGILSGMLHAPLASAALGWPVSILIWVMHVYTVPRCVVWLLLLIILEKDFYKNYYKIYFFETRSQKQPLG